jgi:hypothetical protein
MLRLYEIAADLRGLLETGIDDETGEMSDELTTALATFDGKATSVAAYVLNIEAEVDAVKSAISRLMNRRRALEARGERMREYLSRNMKACGITRIDAKDGTFCVRFYPERDEQLTVDPAVALPEAFLRIKTEPDKAKLKAAIKAGEPVPSGVHLVRNDRLTIA